MKRADISSPFIGGAIGAIVAMFFFPPAATSFAVSMGLGILGAAVGFGILECLAGGITAPKPVHKLLYFAGLVALIAAAHFVIQTYSPRLNPQFTYTLF